MSNPLLYLLAGLHYSTRPANGELWWVMSSFFTSIRGYFDSKYDGRYFSILLRELAENEPRSFSTLIDRIALTSSSTHWRAICDGLRDRTLNAVCEHGFLGNTNRRRSDVAFLREKRPLLFIEVKEFDHSNQTNPEQLADYLALVRDDVGFVYVYRFLPKPELCKGISRAIKQRKPVALLSYEEIYTALREQIPADRPIAKLVCSYLEDIGVGIYREIDLKGEQGPAAKFLLAQMLAFPHAAGMGRLQGADNVRAGPELMKELLGNVEYIGELIRDANIKIIPQHFNQRFWIEPKFDHKKLRNVLRESGDVIEELPPGIWRYVKGGSIYFQSLGTIRLQKNLPYDRLNVTVGIGLELDIGGKVKTYVYSSFHHGKQFSEDDTYDNSDYLRSFPTQDVALRLFSKCLKQSLKLAQKQAHGPVASALRDFDVPSAKPML